MCALSILILVSLPFVFIFSLIFFNYLFFRTIQPVVLDTNYINLKNQIIKAERRVLKELGFCVHVKHPHKVINWWIWLYRKFIELKEKKACTICYWNKYCEKIRWCMYYFTCFLDHRYVPEVVGIGQLQRASTNVLVSWNVS